MSADEPSAAAAAFARQRAAMAVTDTTGPEKAVLIVLAIMANVDAEAWPPVSGATGLTSRCSLGERTVQRSLRGLETLGHVTRHQRRDGVVYIVHPATQAPRHTGTPPHRPFDPATQAPKQPVTTIPQKTTSSSGANSRSKAAKPAVKPLPDLPPGTLAERWDAFAEMRVAMSKGAKPRPWTPGAAAASIRKLTALAATGEDPNAVLDRSTAEGWQGLWPLHGDRRSNGGGGSTGEGRTMRAMRVVIDQQRRRAEPQEHP